MFVSPIFGRVNIPARAKVGLMVSLTYLFFVSFPPVAPIAYTTLVGFALICINELLIGVAIAFVTNIFFSLTFIAGQLIDMQIGFGIVNVYDVQNNTQIPMVGNILNLVLLLVFFAVNGHRWIIQMMHLTLEKLPVGNLVFRPEIGLVAAELFAKSFLLGVMVAMPVIASGLILEITFGMLIRTVPQMNMFVVGIPIKILVGFVVLLFTIPMFVDFSATIFQEMYMGVEKMFSTFVVAS